MLASFSTQHLESDFGPKGNPQNDSEISHNALVDNRDNSHDSRFREVGFIPFESIVGRFESVYWNSED